MRQVNRLLNFGIWRRPIVTLLWAILTLCVQLCAASPVVADSTFRVGVILPLSGPAADYGLSMQNSIHLAQKDFPKLFQNIEFVFEDAEYHTHKAVSAFHKLVDVNSVDIVYTWGLSFCKALAALAEQRKVPLIGQCIESEATADKKYVIKFMNPVDDYLKPQVHYLHKNGYKHIGVLVAEHPYLDDMLDSLMRNLLSDQSVVVLDRFPISEMNLRSTITKIRQRNFDAIGVFLYPGQIAQFFRQAKEQNLAVPAFGTNFFESSSEILAAGGSMDGTHYVHNLVNENFITRYEKTFGKASQIGFGALAYEFARLTAELFGREPTNPSSEEILRRYASIKQRAGIAVGDFTFHQNPKSGKSFTFPLGIKEIKDSKIQVLPEGI